MDHRIERVILNLGQNLHRRVRLTELASSVNLSVSRLSHLFRAETGSSLHAYVKRIRLQKAREFLERGFLLVKEIAFLVGYKSVSQFIRDFSETYGESPLEYRRRFRGRTARKQAHRGRSKKSQ